MPTATYWVSGRGPAVVLLHGIGPGPECFAEVADDLAADHQVLTVARPWSAYRSTSLDEQALAVVAALHHADVGSASIVGVSGGATLALRLAAYAPEVVTALVVHEPLVGAHAPTLVARLAEDVRRVQADDGEVIGFVRASMGEPAWERITPTARVHVATGAARARSEVPVFASFSPTSADLEALRAIPVLTTVGETSGPEWMEAALVLARLSGAAVEVVEEAGNLVHVDQPEAFASLVRDWIAAALSAEGVA